MVRETDRQKPQLKRTALSITQEGTYQAYNSKEEKYDEHDVDSEMIHYC